VSVTWWWLWDPKFTKCSVWTILTLRNYVIKFIFFFLSLDPFRPTYGSCRGLPLHLITLSSTYTRLRAVGLPLDDRSARRIDLNLTTYNTYKRQTFMSPAGFEPPVLASQPPPGSAVIKFQVIIIALIFVLSSCDTHCLYCFSPYSCMCHGLI